MTIDYFFPFLSQLLFGKPTSLPVKMKPYPDIVEFNLESIRRITIKSPYNTNKRELKL